MEHSNESDGFNDFNINTYAKKENLNLCQNESKIINITPKHTPKINIQKPQSPILN
jgi:hypothetical protein